MRSLFALCAVFALVSCETPSTTAPDPIPLPQPIEIDVAVDFSCRYHGLNPFFTFHADASPDTLELAYHLAIDQVVPDSAGTFRDTLTVDWGTDAGTRSQSVTYTIVRDNWTVRSTLSCSV